MNKFQMGGVMSVR